MKRAALSKSSGRRTVRWSRVRILLLITGRIRAPCESSPGSASPPVLYGYPSRSGSTPTLFRFIHGADD